MNYQYNVISTYSHGGDYPHITTVMRDDTIIVHKNINDYLAWCEQHNVKIHPGFDESIYPATVKSMKERMNKWKD